MLGRWIASSETTRGMDYMLRTEVSSKAFQWQLHNDSETRGNYGELRKLHAKFVRCWSSGSKMHNLYHQELKFLCLLFSFGRSSVQCCLVS